MKTLIKCLREDWLAAVLAPLMKLLEAGLELLVPLVLLDMVDQGIRTADRVRLGWDFVLLLVFALVGIFVASLAQRFSARTASKASSRLRALVFARLQAASCSDWDKESSAERMTYLNNDC